MSSSQADILLSGNASSPSSSSSATEPVSLDAERSSSGRRYPTRSRSNRLSSSKADGYSDITTQQTKSAGTDKSKKSKALKPKEQSNAAAPADSPPSASDESQAALRGPSSFAFPDNATFSGIMDRSTVRSRPSLPVPVPNLTKKSRGRRVPTQLTEGQDGAQKRTYVCTVEGCGKCFSRGEHLKRHIRSIHTHEKPFKCSYTHCDKYFNRHDNLLQHLKVHQEYTAAQDDNIPTSYTAPFQVIQEHPQSSSSGDSNAEHGEGSSQSQQSRSYPSYAGSTAASFSFATNMAVSSLRTELPRSPPHSHDICYHPTAHTRYGAYGPPPAFHSHPPELIVRLASGWQS